MAGMVDITPKLADDAQLINGYGEGFFTISNQRYEGSVLVTAQETSFYEVKDFTQIDIDELAEQLLSYDPEIELVLFGTGAMMQPLPPTLKAGLKEKGIASDVMDSRAVCRTFNILLSEERKVAALMLPIC